MQKKPFPFARLHDLLNVGLISPPYMYDFQEVKRWQGRQCMTSLFPKDGNQKNQQNVRQLTDNSS